jgi:hypothetical protein
MIDIGLIAGCLALVWSAMQEFRINRICLNCPYYPPNTTEIKREPKL